MYFHPFSVRTLGPKWKPLTTRRMTNSVGSAKHLFSFDFYRWCRRINNKLDIGNCQWIEISRLSSFWSISFSDKWNCWLHRLNDNHHLIFTTFSWQVNESDSKRQNRFGDFHCFFSFRLNSKLICSMSRRLRIIIRFQFTWGFHLFRFVDALLRFRLNFLFFVCSVNQRRIR